MDGHVVSFDVRTGHYLSDLQLQCAPARENESSTFPALLRFFADSILKQRFGWKENVFTGLTAALFGARHCVCNAIAAYDGFIYIAATHAPIEKVDSTEVGALYKLKLSKEKQLEEVGKALFAGGTSSTPTISADGKRAYVSDDERRVIALDTSSMERIWEFTMPEPIAASIAVSDDNFELGVATKAGIYKLFDRGDFAELAWRADTSNLFTGDPPVWNNLTPTFTANGIAVAFAAVLPLKFLKGKRALNLAAGVGLVDRETGKFRSFTFQREESISITSVGADGGVYLSSSPMRRILAQLFLLGSMPPLVGGIAKYRASNTALFVRDAICAASHRSNKLSSASVPGEIEIELAQIQALLEQVKQRKENEHDISRCEKYALKTRDLVELRTCLSKECAKAENIT